MTGEKGVRGRNLSSNSERFWLKNMLQQKRGDTISSIYQQIQKQDDISNAERQCVSWEEGVRWCANKKIMLDGCMRCDTSRFQNGTWIREFEIEYEGAEIQSKNEKTLKISNEHRAKWKKYMKKFWVSQTTTRIHETQLN